MRRSIAFAIFAGLIAGLCVRYFNIGLNVEAETTSNVGGSEIIKRLREWRVESVYTWDTGDTKRDSLACLIQAIDDKAQEEGQRVELTIFDPSGLPIYEESFDSVIRIYQSYALRSLHPQLVVEAVYGGTGSYRLQMFDYRNGKIVKLIKGEDGHFNANADLRPQFRSGVVPAVEPFQLLMTQGVSLASPAPKFTRAYRYRQNAYEYVGEFAQQKLDDYMERLLKESKKR
jgi:hypothetical protein